MPRRRTTRAATTKRLIPTLPEDDNENSLDEDQKKLKVQALILDFKAEVESRIQDLEHCATNVLNQIDLAYSIEIMQIPQDIRNMPLTDFLKNGGSFQKPVAAVTMNEAIRAIVGAHVESVVEEKENQSTTVKKTSQRQRQKVSEAPGTSQQTVRRTGRGRKPVFETPANTQLSMLSMATPLVTPKFDPRLYQTPAVVMRKPKLGDVLMSIDGSPITNVGSANPSAGLLVQIDDSQSVFLADNTDFNNVDENAISKAYQTLEEMKARLDAVVKTKTAAN